jgi:hypothetical protein
MATTFDLDIRFTGICAFVPNLDAAGRYSLCVVMPGSDQPRNAIDGESLQPHVAFVGFFPAEPPLHPQPSKQVPLKHCRVALDVSPRSGRPILPGISSPYLLDLPDLIGTHAVIDAAIVDSNPPDPPVMAQVLLGDGKISYLPDITAKWSIEKLDNGNARSKVDLVHQVVLSLTSVTDARLIGTTFDGSRFIDIDLNPATVPGAAVVRIVNFCRVAPLPAKSDRDFKWYHELLVDGGKQAIRDELGSGNNQDLPIPRATLSSLLVGGGQDCFPASLPAVTFGT